MKTAYRPDIDGLRAIAVISVLLYHLKVWPFGGGFVGVDIFFVISGFLITRKIREEVLLTGTSSPCKFYIARARRLFPAMFFVLALSFVAGAIILAPTHLAKFGGSLVNAVASLSNIYFWSQVSYFDTSAGLKPLLHTWSLSVEEQFYLLWPWLVILFVRFRWGIGLTLLLAVGMASFVLNCVWHWDQATIFYWTIFRIFEFVFGAAIVWLNDAFRPARMGRELLCAVGLALLAYSVLTYSDQMVFPSYNALIPCLGAALLIYAGEARYFGIILRNRVAVGLGLISYSVYLIHWPLIVFYRYSGDGAFTAIETASLFVLSIIAGTGMYFWVEQPFRRQTPSTFSRPAFGLACSMLALVLMVPSANAWGNSGWLWRYSPAIARQLSLPARENDHYVHLRKNTLNFRPFANDGKIKVLVIGDSMSGDLVNELYEGGLAEKIDLRTMRIDSPCLPVITAAASVFQKAAPTAWRGCVRATDAVKKALPDRRSDIIMLASDWRSWSFNDLPQTIELLKQFTNKVVIIGMKINTTSGLQFLSRYARRSDIKEIRVPRAASTKANNARLAAIAKANGAEFYDPTDLYCDAGGCQMVGQNDQMIFYDSKHLTRYGAYFLGHRLKAAWSAKLFSLPENQGS